MAALTSWIFFLVQRESTEQDKDRFMLVLKSPAVKQPINCKLSVMVWNEYISEMDGAVYISLPLFCKPAHLRK